MVAPPSRAPLPYPGRGTTRGNWAASWRLLGPQVPTDVITNLCCGSFLSTAHPEVTQPLVNKVMQSAVAKGAECLVTSCAMCQLNLEMRCTLKEKLPIFHFSEILALAFGVREDEGWFPRHLTDPGRCCGKRVSFPNPMDFDGKYSDGWTGFSKISAGSIERSGAVSPRS